MGGGDDARDHRLSRRALRRSLCLRRVVGRRAQDAAPGPARKGQRRVDHRAPPAQRRAPRAHRRDRSWHFTAEARKALRQLQDQADAAVFSIDVVQGNVGEPWFLCMCGDDYDLQQRVKSLPGAFLDDADDSWWVPADSEAACADLLEIAEHDDRLEVSPAAWRLLEEPDGSFALPRSATVQARGADDAAGDAACRRAPGTRPSSTTRCTRSAPPPTRTTFKVSPALRGTLLPFQVAGVRYLCLGLARGARRRARPRQDAAGARHHRDARRIPCADRVSGAAAAAAGCARRSAGCRPTRRSRCCRRPSSRCPWSMSSSLATTASRRIVSCSRSAASRPSSPTRATT